MNSEPAGFISKMQQFLTRGLWDLDLDTLPKSRRCALKFLRVCTLALKGFSDNKCPLHASALTFTTVMALVPLLVILFAIAKGLGFEAASQKLMTWAANSGLPDSFQQIVSNLLKTVESASAGTLGSIGTVLFMWAAIKMLSSIEDTFNIVWSVKTPRTLVDKIRNYIVVLVAAPVLLIVANAGLPVIMGLADKLAWMGPVLKTALGLVPVFVMALAFTIMYILLPNTKVKLSAATTGAFISALLSILFQFAITKLGVGVTSYNKVYGTLAAIPLFLFWLQTSWMILLLGAEVAFSLQSAHTYARERMAITPSARARLCLAFALMKKITAAFETGTGPFDVAACGTSARIPVRLIHDVISILAKNGLVAESVKQRGSYTLLRDPVGISARMITDAILNEGADPHELGMKDDYPLFGKITGESFQTLEKQILKSF